MEKFFELARTTVFGITLTQIGLAFLAILGGYIVRFILLAAINRAMVVAERTEHEYDNVLLDAFHKPVGLSVVLAGIWGAFILLDLPSEPVNIARFVNGMLKASLIIISVWLGIRLINGLSGIFIKKAESTPSPLDDQLVPMARNTLKAFLVVIGAVIILQDLGYSVSSLLAGLGLGGMAIALASKDTLANLFGSMVIFIDRPFHVGDWIEMGDIEGTVEEVGLRVTRIRTFANSLITLPNASLTTDAINNWSRMKKRRIKMTIGLTYSTTPEQMEKIVEALKKIIAEDPKMDHDFYLVNFTEFSAYSLDIFIYCFTLSTVWAEFLQAKQELLLKFMSAIEEHGLEIAYPTKLSYRIDVKE
ncbi:mechanosensitive ion channel family protein [Calditrichota bacterium]